MSAPNPQEEITKLEGELKQMQDNHLEAETHKNNALNVMAHCRDQIIAIQKAIDTHKMYLPEESVKTEPAGFTNN